MMGRPSFGGFPFGVVKMGMRGQARAQAPGRREQRPAARLTRDTSLIRASSLAYPFSRQLFYFLHMIFQKSLN